jgi:hypothetical protein
LTVKTWEIKTLMRSWRAVVWISTKTGQVIKPAALSITTSPAMRPACGLDPLPQW